MEAVSEDNLESTLIHLPKDGELCVVVPLDESRCSSSISLKNSSDKRQFISRVDVLGAPLIPGVEYYLVPGSSFNIYSWTSSTIEIKGSHQLIQNLFKTTTKSILRPIVEYHCILDQLRVECYKKGEVGPIVLVCGSSTCGKPNIVRSLCGYAARSGWKPLLVDLDNGIAQTVSVPGSIGVAITEFPVAIDEVISQTHVTFSYFTGSLECQNVDDFGTSINPSYLHYTSLLLDVVQERLTAQHGTTYAAGGAIIILPQLVGLSGANFSIDVAGKYSCSHILCCGDDYLFHKLYSRFCENTSVISTTVHKMSESYFSLPSRSLEILLPKRFESFFYGSGSINLSPASWVVSLDKIEIFMIKEEPNKPIPVLVSVERKDFLSIIGCIAGLFSHNHSQNLLTTAPFAHGKIDSVDARGIHFLTTPHIQPERLCALVGSVRWLT